MKNSPAEIIQAFITAQSGATFTDPASQLPEPLFISSLPDQPDGAGCVYDTTGVVYTRLLKSGFTIESYGVQIKARGLSYSTTYSLVSELAFMLGKVTRALVTLGENEYTIDTIRKTSPVLNMGQDDKRRALVSVNFLVMLIAPTT